MLWSDFQKPKKLDYDPETLTPNYGRFIAQPFERGFGTTIGNALRRVLLSSIEGAAVTAVRVEGVLRCWGAGACRCKNRSRVWQRTARWRLLGHR